MGNTNSTSNQSNEQEVIISKIQNLLGGDSSEEQNNNAWDSKDESNLTKNNLDSTFITNSKNFVNAVSGDTEDNLKNNEVFATTSEELPFTETEILIPGVLNENQNGGDIIQNLRNLILNSERLTENGNSLFLNNNINQIERLLTETENFNLVGGSNILQNLRNILDNLTESAPPAPVNNASIINLRGGALENQNLFTSEDKMQTEEKNTEDENMKEEKMKEDENNAVESSEQSGGEQLDTELKEILKSLHKDSQNNSQSHKGGKGAKSRKSSRKSSKAKTKSSRRTKTDMTDMDATEDTYDLDSDSGGETEDYLTSTSSLNTSDIQIKHYR